MADTMTKEDKINFISSKIKQMKEKDFNVYFYIFDTQGTPNGMLEYIYTTALSISKLGYKVTMLHNEKEDFVGVGAWLGEAYAELPHLNTSKDNVEMSPCDFLFIPEALSNVMIQTKDLPCKRIMVLQNFKFLTEFMPIGVTPFHLKITDCVTNTLSNKALMETYFPGLNTEVVKPVVKNVFRNNDGARKLVINIVAKDKNDANTIVRTFYWKYPVYKWVGFRDIRGVSEEVFAEALRESPITICVDRDSNFGYNIAESLACGSLTIAKVPERLSDWMVDEDGKLNESVLWFDDLHMLPDMIAGFIKSWTEDEIPSDINETIEKGAKAISNTFSLEHQSEDIEKYIVSGLFEKRTREFEEVLKQLENNVIK